MSRVQLPDDLPEYVVYAVNLPFDEDEEGITTFFSKAGNVLSCKLILTKEGNKKGQAKIAYRTKKEAEYAVYYLHNLKFKNRIIKTNWDKQTIMLGTHCSSEEANQILEKEKREKEGFETPQMSTIKNTISEIYINQNATEYEITLGQLIDRSQGNSYALLYQDRIRFEDLPFRTPNETSPNV